MLFRSAEDMADRVGVIHKGELIVVEQKAELMRKLGKKQLVLHLQAPITAVPNELAGYSLEVRNSGGELVYTYDTHAERTGITALLADLSRMGIRFNDLQTKQSSLEEIFVKLIGEHA